MNVSKRRLICYIFLINILNSMSISKIDHVILPLFRQINQERNTIIIY